MTDERSTFETTRARLEDIVTQVRRKDVSLEQSLDMLEEAVRLVNQCNDLIDQTSWQRPEVAEDADGPLPEQAASTRTVDGVDTDGDGRVDLVEIVEAVDTDGDGTVDLVDVVDLVDTDGDGIVDVVLETVTLRGRSLDGEGTKDGDAAADSVASPEDDARE